jgi:prepilin-type N-terminal cleavage/methylation domain-containing protein
MKSRKGFTLIEFLLIIIILGILMSIAMPIYERVRDKDTYRNHNGVNNNAIINDKK